jgi:hypothetical protein
MDFAAIAQQGGFAVLAAFFGYLGFKGAQMWVSDVKKSHEREMATLTTAHAREAALFERVLENTVGIEKAVTNLCDEVATLNAAISRFRT